jgi:hypothetical protein
MIDSKSGRPRWLTLPLLLGLAFAACAQKHDDRPSAPETAAPAPAPAASSAEDRGQQKPGDAAKPADDQDAFSHVGDGESERAASQRGHESAGEQAPAAHPGSGG